jgi:tetratricopeptide (TPR) repeat protein
MGKRVEAIAAYEAALPLASRNALLWVRLGELYRDAGDAGTAITLLREAVVLDPAVASYWDSRGMLLGAHDEMPEAEKPFREATPRARSTPTTSASTRPSRPLASASPSCART